MSQLHALIGPGMSIWPGGSASYGHEETLFPWANTVRKQWSFLETQHYTTPLGDFESAPEATTDWCRVQLKACDAGTAMTSQRGLYTFGNFDIDNDYPDAGNFCSGLLGGSDFREDWKAGLKVDVSSTGPAGFEAFDIAMTHLNSEMEYGQAFEPAGFFGVEGARTYPIGIAGGTCDAEENSRLFGDRFPEGHYPVQTFFHHPPIQDAGASSSSLPHIPAVRQICGCLQEEYQIAEGTGAFNTVR